MNYVVPSCIFGNLKSVGMVTNSFQELVKSKLFVDLELIVPHLHLQVSSVNQNRIVIVKVADNFNMKYAAFVADVYEDVMDVVVHYSHSVKLFFCGAKEDFIVIIQVDSVGI